MTLEVIKNTIKEATVRITVTTASGSEKGTGVLVNQNGKYYILTVYHSIYGKDEIPSDISYENIELEFYSTVSSVNQSPKNLESIASNIVIMEVDSNNIEKPENGIEYIDRVLYEKNYHIRGFPTILNGEAQFFEAVCNDNDINTIGFSIELKNLTGDTSGEDAIKYISGLSGSGVFFSEHNKLYLVGLVNSLASTGGVFNRVNCIKLIDINKSDIDIKFSAFYSIDDISKKLKNINKEIAKSACEEFEDKNTSLYQNLNRKHTNIFHEQDVYTKNFHAIKNYLRGRNSVSEIKLLSSSFENDLIELSDDILEEVERSIGKHIATKKDGQDNLQRIEDKTIEAIKEELKLIKSDRYISNKLQEYLIVGWLLNCNVDFILDDNYEI